MCASWPAQRVQKLGAIGIETTRGLPTTLQVLRQSQCADLTRKPPRKIPAAGKSQEHTLTLGTFNLFQGTGSQKGVMITLGGRSVGSELQPRKRLSKEGRFSDQATSGIGPGGTVHERGQRLVSGQHQRQRDHATLCCSGAPLESLGVPRSGPGGLSGNPPSRMFSEYHRPKTYDRPSTFMVGWWLSRELMRESLSITWWYRSTVSTSLNIQYLQSMAKLTMGLNEQNNDAREESTQMSEKNDNHRQGLPNASNASKRLAQHKLMSIPGTTCKPTPSDTRPLLKLRPFWESTHDDHDV